MTGGVSGDGSSGEPLHEGRATVGSWVGPWVPFSKLSRQKAIQTCEILIEQRDRQIRRAEAAEARLAEVEAERDRAEERWAEWFHRGTKAEAKLAAVEALCGNAALYGFWAFIGQVRAAARGEGDL